MSGEHLRCQCGDPDSTTATMFKGPSEFPGYLGQPWDLCLEDMHVGLEALSTTWRLTIRSSRKTLLEFVVRLGWHFGQGLQFCH
jgi:hypothetical protein